MGVLCDRVNIEIENYGINIRVRIELIGYEWEYSGMMVILGG